MRNPLQSMMETQFSQVAQNINRAMEELEAMQIVGSAGGGAVKVTVTGTGNILSVEIAPAAVKQEDIELLQDLVCAAVRDAITRANELRKEKMMQSTPLGMLGADLPNLF